MTDKAMTISELMIKTIENYMDGLENTPPQENLGRRTEANVLFEIPDGFFNEVCFYFIRNPNKKWNISLGSFGFTRKYGTESRPVVSIRLSARNCGCDLSIV